MWDWPCSKFLALHCINLYAVENPHPVHRNYAFTISAPTFFGMLCSSVRFVNIAFAEFQTWNRYRCRSTARGGKLGIAGAATTARWSCSITLFKYLEDRTRTRPGNLPAAFSLSTARCEAAYPSRVITLGAPCGLTAREKNRLASENG